MKSSLAHKPTNTFLVVRNEKGESRLNLFAWGTPATKELLKPLAKRLALAFPRLEQSVIIIIMSRILERQMTIEHATAAVNNAIDNFEYANLTPGNVLSFECTVPIYTFSEYTRMQIEYNTSFDRLKFARLVVNGKMYYIDPTMKRRYNIPDQYGARPCYTNNGQGLTLHVPRTVMLHPNEQNLKQIES